MTRSYRHWEADSHPGDFDPPTRTRGYWASVRKWEAWKAKNPEATSDEAYEEWLRMKEEDLLTDEL